MENDLQRYKLNHKCVLIRRENSSLLTKSRKEAIIIDGIEIANEIQAKLKEEIQSWVKKGNRPPSLVAFLVGKDAASEKYIEKKMKASAEVGINSRTEKFEDTVNESYLLERIKELNNDPSVDGILVQLPLPSHMNEALVCNAVAADKDVDGFNIENCGKLFKNMKTFVPCTVGAVFELLERYKISTFGKNAVVCGRSKNIGQPIANLLHSDKKYELPGYEATVTLCHRHTPADQLEKFCKNADIIISATGVVGLIKPHMVKPGACVIDVGTTRITTCEGKTRIVGDVEFEGVKKVAGYITPVPGGVGPMTVAMLMKNTFEAAKLHVR